MKKFYLNSFIFILIFSALIIALDLLSMREPYSCILAELTESSEYFGGGPDEIRPYIQSAQANDGTTRLIIGDSVCHQMFSGLQEYNDDFTIIGSNGAITMAGQYILAKEYLENHPSASDVFLIVLPKSLGRTFDTLYGYQYSVMPFVESDTLKDLDSNTIDIMANTYGKLFMEKSVVRALYLSAINRRIYLNVLANKTRGYELSNHFELADQYVVKIAQMCDEKGVRFHLYPCPVCETKKESIDDMQSGFEQSKIYDINPDFLNMIQYYPAEQAEDGAHFSGEYDNQECFNEKIRQIYTCPELIDNLKFD